MLDQPLTMDAATILGGLHASLLAAAGSQQVVVRLSQPSVAARVTAEGLEATAQADAVQAINAQHDRVIASARSLDADVKVLGQTRLALNAVMLEIDAAALSALAANPNVVSINPVVNYELDLTETVPYIGATAVQGQGFDGTGVSVAVLDSGIDYNHAALGGSGNPADFAANNPNIIEPGTFPTAKVVGGTDFVGPTWTGATGSPPLAPDPDPLDAGSGRGHGTHVADIIGGAIGVAPGVDLYAVKVCSSISTSCSGVALIQGMDFILDPNGDNDISDRVDIVNMSLGSTMGDPVADDLSFAVENVSAQGVLVVASAGNSADKAYMNGTPSASPAALAVAQTNVPSALQDIMEVTEPASIAGIYAAVFQPWSAPLTSAVSGPLQYGNGAGGNLNGCAPFAPGSLTGLVVLVDRGACNFSLKIKTIGDAGGVAGIIALIAPGDPFQGGDGGERPITAPGFMISQADANTLRSGLAEGTVTVVFDPANGIPLVGHVVGSSSRGPNIALNQVKPEIGAPGASVSAIAGSGTGTGPFGGTSGAAPMVAGSAALLMQAYPDRSWAEIKAVLVNTGETNIMNAPALFGGDLAAITRIGGGEVRVDRALATEVAAWEEGTLSSALSWGFHDVTRQVILQKRIVVHNYSNSLVRLRTAVSFRFANDADGEVRIQLPSQVAIPAGQSRVVPVLLRVQPKNNAPLHEWAMNSGSQGANPAALTLNEYDGYVTFEEVGNPANSIHMPWMVLPRAAGDIEVRNDSVRNRGIAATFIDTFSLIGVSPDMPEGAPGAQELRPDFKYIGVQTYPVDAGVCGPNPSFIMGFAVHTWERQTHANPTSFQFFLNTDADAADEFLVLNRDFTLNNVTDGRNLTFVVNLATGQANAFFFTTHFTNSGNTVLLFCGDQIGLNASSFGVTSIGVDAIAQDFYFGGPGDSVLNMNVVPLGERYFTVFDNGDQGFTTLPPKSPKLDFEIVDFGTQLNATETGVLWLYGPGAPANNEATAIVLQP